MHIHKPRSNRKRHSKPHSTTTVKFNPGAKPSQSSKRYPAKTTHFRQQSTSSQQPPVFQLTPSLVTPDQIQSILTQSRNESDNSSRSNPFLKRFQLSHDNPLIFEINHIKSLASSLRGSKNPHVPFTPYEEQILIPKQDKIPASLNSPSPSCPLQLPSPPHPPRLPPTPTVPNKVTRLLFNSLMLSAKPFLASNFLTTMHRPRAYALYSYHQFISNIFGAAGSVVSIQALLLAVGLSAIEATPAAAALTWVLKDLLGNVGGSVFASKVSQNYESQPRLGRMRSALLYIFASFVEILSPLVHNQLLLLGTFTTLLKNVSWILTASSRATTHLTFSPTSHIGEVTAKTGAQSTAAGVIGTSLGAGLSYWLTHNIPAKNQLNSPPQSSQPLSESLETSLGDSQPISEALEQLDSVNQFAAAATTTSTTHQPVILLAQCCLFFLLSAISVYQLDRSLKHVHYNRFDLQRFTHFLNNLSDAEVPRVLIPNATTAIQSKDSDQESTNSNNNNTPQPSTQLHFSSHPTSIEDITPLESIYQAYMPPHSNLTPIQIGQKSPHSLFRSVFRSKKPLTALKSHISRRFLPSSPITTADHPHSNQLYSLGSTPSEIANTINLNLQYPYYLSIQTPTTNIANSSSNSDTSQPYHSRNSDLVTTPHTIKLSWKPLTQINTQDLTDGDIEIAPLHTTSLPTLPSLQRLHQIQPTSARGTNLDQNLSSISHNHNINTHEAQLLGLSHALIVKQLLLQRHVKYIAQSQPILNHESLNTNTFEKNIFSLTQSVLHAYEYQSHLPSLSNNDLVDLAGKILYSKSFTTTSTTPHSKSFGETIIAEIRHQSWDTTSVYDASTPIQLPLQKS